MEKKKSFWKKYAELISLASKPENKESLIPAIFFGWFWILVAEDNTESNKKEDK